MTPASYIKPQNCTSQWQQSSRRSSPTATSRRSVYSSPLSKLFSERPAATIKAVKELATAEMEGGMLEWTCLDYADKSQDPLASYGVENINRLKAIAAKYDPDQVFQELCSGGFKIS
ncbi:hypothetical protein HD806DRAFT_541991 [Xylariaceae sp. AK1471]|nr:hypothetical protein HD806DRAFT_541991 [Xylariaceae sp. AK1471]